MNSATIYIEDLGTVNLSANTTTDLDAELERELAALEAEREGQAYQNGREAYRIAKSYGCN